MDAINPPIGHNSSSYLQMIEADPDLVYRDTEALEKAVAEIEAKLASAEVDLVTSKGRSEIASRAAELSRLKVQIEQAGLKRTEEWRKATDAVNAVKKTVKVRFDALRDKAREPLTKWEEEKERREQQINLGLERIDALGSPRLGCSVADLELLLVDLAYIPLTEEMFGDHLLIAEAKAGRAKSALDAALARAQADERDRAELARLRAEAAKREEEDRKREAEAKAAEAERLRKEQEAAQAEARARRAAEEAAEAERRRVEKEAADKRAEEERQKAEAERRARDYAHREKVMGEAHAALQAIGLGPKQASKIIDAIIMGGIPHVTITF